MHYSDNRFFLLPDNRRLLSYKPIAAKHCPDHHLRGGPPADGCDRVRRLLEVSKTLTLVYSYVTDERDIT